MIAWPQLCEAVEAVGRVTVSGEIVKGSTEVRALARLLGAVTLPGQDPYRSALLRDLLAWAERGGAPDFTQSRDALRPVARGEGTWAILFPMRMANATGEMRLDAALLRTLEFDSWAQAVRDMHHDVSNQPARFVAAELLGCSSGFGDHSTVVFPEMVATPKPPAFQAWSIFLSGRKAERYARFLRAGHIQPMYGLENADVEAVALCSACHDMAHDIGPLPYVARLGQTMTIEQEALEEVRADLHAHAFLNEMAIPQGLRLRAARYLLTDRTLRYTLTNPGSYDDLGGRALLGWLRTHGAVSGRGPETCFNMEACREAMRQLQTRVYELNRDGAKTEKVGPFVRELAEGA